MSDAFDPHSPPGFDPETNEKEEKQVIASPHDALFKSTLTDPRMARAFLETYLPPAVCRLMNFNHIKPMDRHFVSQYLRFLHSDVIFEVECAGEPGYVMVISEHQSTPERLMPLRALQYKLAFMDSYMKAKKSKTLPLVYVLVYYSGKRPWTYSLDFFDLFEEHQRELARDWFFQPLQVVKPNRI